MAEKKILAWHFVAESGKLGYDCGLEVAPGYIYTEDAPKLSLCKVGLHASLSVRDALQYAPGPILCRVRVWGDVQHDTDKLVARHREVLAMKDVSSELRLRACWCVRQVWHLLDDERSKRAVEVAEAFARGQASKDDLSAAESAAWSAAESAAESAAWSAAESAAWSAARSAAWSAARSAAWSAQTRELDRIMREALGVE